MGGTSGLLILHDIIKSYTVFDHVRFCDLHLIFNPNSVMYVLVVNAMSSRVLPCCVLPLHYLLDEVCVTGVEPELA